VFAGGNLVWVCGVTPGATFAGLGVGVPGRAVGLIDALGGTGSLPCWIREARCATAGGTAAPAGEARPDTAGAGLPGERPAAAAAGGWLMTLLMIVVLWMFV
jgi:hypothetical protein